MNTTTDITVPNVNDLAAAIEAARERGHAIVAMDVDGELMTVSGTDWVIDDYWHDTYGPLAPVMDMDAAVLDTETYDELNAMDPRDAARELAETAIELGWVAEARAQAARYRAELITEGVTL